MAKAVITALILALLISACGSEQEISRNNTEPPPTPKAAPIQNVKEKDPPATDASPGATNQAVTNAAPEHGGAQAAPIKEDALPGATAMPPPEPIAASTAATHDGSTVSVVSDGETAEAAAPFIKKKLGESVRGQPIMAYTFNQAPARPFIVMMTIHGDEIESEYLSKKLEQRWTRDPSALDGVHVIFLSCVNPDGLAARTRKNANGVDCNRNFPAQWEPASPSAAYYGGPEKLSEPESKIIFKLINEQNPLAIISVHSCRSCGGMNNFDGPAEDMARLMTKFNGYKTTGEWYVKTPGSLGTWAGKEMNIPMVTLEMPRGTSSDKQLQKNIDAIEAAIKKFGARGQGEPAK